MTSAFNLPIKARDLDNSHVGRTIFSDFEPQIRLDGKLLAVREEPTSKSSVKKIVLMMEIVLNEDDYVTLAANA